jgi:hypothetical protein
VLPAGRVVAHSYDLICATCQHPLGISDLSRNLAAFAGLVAGAIAWWIVTSKFASQPGALDWVWPVFLAYLTACVLFIDLYILPQSVRRRMCVIRPTEVE